MEKKDKAGQKRSGRSKRSTGRELERNVHPTPNPRSRLEADDAPAASNSLVWEYSENVSRQFEAGAMLSAGSPHLTARVPQYDDVTSGAEGSGDVHSVLQEFASMSVTGGLLQSDDVGFARHRSSPVALTDRTQPSFDEFHPGHCPEASSLSTTVQPSDAILSMWRCAICLVLWCNAVLKFCRHLSCDVCLSKYRSKCGICRGEVAGAFPIRFHSVHMINGLNIPELSLSDEQCGLMKTLTDMGFERYKIKKAIHQLSANTTTLTEDNIIECIVQSDEKEDELVGLAYSIPTPEEMESFLNDPKADPEVKTKLGEWLEVAGKCLICKVKSPSICLIPCHHLALCMECYEGPHKPNQCPDSHCGQPINNQVKIHI